MTKEQFSYMTNFALIGAFIAGNQYEHLKLLQWISVGLIWFIIVISFIIPFLPEKHTIEIVEKKLKEGVKKARAFPLYVSVLLQGVWLVAFFSYGFVITGVCSFISFMITQNYLFSMEKIMNEKLAQKAQEDELATINRL